MVAVTPWHKLGYDIFAHHTIWNQEEVEKIMPNDTVYISILRNPVDLFESLYSYAELNRIYQVDLEEFALADKTSGPLSQRASKHLGQNQMLFDFGLATSLLQNMTAIKEKIDEIDKRFDLIMIAERFDESMVLLKDLLCWNTSDVTSFKQNARQSGKKTQLSSEAKVKLQDWLKGDQMLYDYFNKKFDDKVKHLGSRLVEAEVENLRSITDSIKKHCSASAEKSSDLRGVLKPYGKIVIGYHVNMNDTECLDFARAENPFTDTLRNIQKIRASTKYKLNKTNHFNNSLDSRLAKAKLLAHEKVQNQRRIRTRLQSSNNIT